MCGWFLQRPRLQRGPHSQKTPTRIYLHQVSDPRTAVAVDRASSAWPLSIRKESRKDILGNTSASATALEPLLLSETINRVETTNHRLQQVEKLGTMARPGQVENRFWESRRAWTHNYLCWRMWLKMLGGLGWFGCVRLEGCVLFQKPPSG